MAAKHDVGEGPSSLRGPPTAPAAAMSLSLGRRKQSSSSRTPRSAPRDYHGVENSATKNVVVLGGSYGGMHAATVLAQKLPPSHRVILIERNSHFNHLYVFPRFSVLPGHEHKAFIPYSSIFGSAPKRRRRHAQAQAAATTSSASASASTSPQGNATTSGNGGSILEMGSRGEVRGRGSDSSASSHSSSSRSADSHFDRDTVSSDVTAASSWESAADAASHDAGNKVMEHALLEDAQVAAHQEEKLGRPEIQVETLGEAMDSGLNLEGGEDGQTSGDDAGATGFEDAEPHVVLQATVTSITDSHVIVTPSSSTDVPASKLWSIDSLSIPYTHLVYALGSHLPDPLRTTSTSRTKPEGISWMRHTQEQIRDAERIVLVGGGALGVEYATDIKSVYPEKDVTLIHSRQRLLPNFDERIHDVAKARLEKLGVKLVLGERLALTEGCPKGSTTAPLDAADEQDDSSNVRPIRRPSDAHHSGWKRVRTTGGRELLCDLLMLCTGQQPNSSLLASLSPTSVDPHTRLIRVHRTLQVALPPPEEATPGPFDARPPGGDCDCFLDKKAAGGELDERQAEHLDEHGRDGEEAKRMGRIPNVYAIGDVADAFGSLNAGYQAWGMADVAAENIIRDIGLRGNVEEEVGEAAETATKSTPAELVRFEPAPNMLKLSLGLGSMVFQGGPVVGDDGVERPEISVKDDPEDLGVEGVWSFMANHPLDDLYL